MDDAPLLHATDSFGCFVFAWSIQNSWSELRTGFVLFTGYVKMCLVVCPLGKCKKLSLPNELGKNRTHNTPTDTESRQPKGCMHVYKQDGHVCRMCFLCGWVLLCRGMWHDSEADTRRPWLVYILNRDMRTVSVYSDVWHNRVCWRKHEDYIKKVYVWRVY